MNSPKISDINTLIPDDKNANKGTQRGRDSLAYSLEHNGAGRSILVDRKGNIIAGNKTWEAARAQGFKLRVVEAGADTLVAVQRKDIDLDSDKGRNLAIADNRIAQLGLDWDADILLELSGVTDLSNYWTPDELSDFGFGGYTNSADEEDDKTSEIIPLAKELEKKWRTKAGQLWEIEGARAGIKHRIYCPLNPLGALSTEVLRELLLEVKPDFVCADPPYGIDIVNPDGTINSSGVWLPVRGDKTTDVAQGSMRLILDLWPKAVQFWWGANHYGAPPSPCWVVWDKENGEWSTADCELAYSNQPTAVRLFRHRWNGGSKASEQGQKRFHPNQKPIALYEWLYEKYGHANMSILDPFMGSASSLVAAERLGHCMYTLDLEPAYVAVALERMSVLGLKVSLVYEKT